MGSKDLRRKVLFWGKIAVSVLVLYLVFRGTDLTLIRDHLVESRKTFWINALLLLILSQVISTLRWHILLKPLDFELAWFRVFRIYFTGMFFSLFLPTQVGGDGVKTYYVAREWKRVPAALYTLLADRTIGLAAMLLFIIIGLPAVGPVWPIWLTLGLAILVPLAYILLLFLPRLATRLLMLSRRLREVPTERLFVYWEERKAAATAWMLSIGIHLCLVVSHISLGGALNLDVPWLAWSAVYPVTALAGFLPISLSGVGPREAAYLFLLGFLGVPRETALAYGIMWFSMVLVSGLIGGLFYIFGGELVVQDAQGT